jgi:outer membrane protein insertion porin family
MNKKILILYFLLTLIVAPSMYANTSFEGKVIENIDITIKGSNVANDTKAIYSKLHTHKGDIFSQITFDEDLKTLSEEFDKVEPKVTTRDQKIYITLVLWPKPTINNITIQGNSYFSTSKLKKELGIKPHTVFNRQAFTTALNKIKDLYLKKGFYQSEITYSIDKVGDEINVIIRVKEGKAGHVDSIVIKGLTKKEESAVRETLYTKKYNSLTSWLTGYGIFKEEALEQDQMSVLSYLQNKGYADAKVDVKILEGKSKNKIILEFVVHRGTLYRFGKITYQGNKLISDKEIEKYLLIHQDGVFSPEKLRETSQAIKDLYGQKGYIETTVVYDTYLMESDPVYNIDFKIDEGDKYKIGLVKVYGNTQTKTNVILRESLLVPGEIFDSRRLMATQARLTNMGYFKNVNVYAVRSTDDLGLGENYRDVYIEVEETSTGNISLFLGISSLEDIYGGLDLTENNFNYKGLFSIFTQGLSALRGGGEYAHAKVNIGAKQSTYVVSWLTPYLRDTLWRLGFEADLTHSHLVAKDYRTKTYGFSVFASYPITNYWTYGIKYRCKESKTHVKASAGAEADKQNDNHGLISGVSNTVNYDSTDNSYKAHKGIRSALEAEFVGIGGNYLFLKFNYLNTLYQPLWSKGTMKYKADFRFIEPMGHTSTDEVPLSERFFLGGETTVRGYKPFIIGPRYAKTNDPQGGISAALLSIEYSQSFHRMIDGFVFADAGSVSQKRFTIPTLRASCGVGLRLEVMNRIPLMVGVGFPINPEHRSDVHKFFFSMGGQF